MDNEKETFIPENLNQYFETSRIVISPYFLKVNFLYLTMYKLNKTVLRAQTNAEAEQDKKFADDTPVGERLKEAWWLTCMAYGLDPANPPKMAKQFFSARKHSR